MPSPIVPLVSVLLSLSGNCYVIANLGEGFELLEAEAVVSLRARNGGADRAPRDLAAEAAMDAKFSSGTLAARAMTAAAAATTSGVVIAPRAPVRVTSAASALSRSSKVGRTSSKRVRKEPQSVVDGVASVWLASGPGTGDGIHLFPSVAADGTTPNFSRIRAIIEGPPGSVFEGGTFVLEGTYAIAVSLFSSSTRVFIIISPCILPAFACIFSHSFCPSKLPLRGAICALHHADLPLQRILYWAAVLRRAPRQLVTLAFDPQNPGNYPQLADHAKRRQCSCVMDC